LGVLVQSIGSFGAVYWEFWCSLLGVLVQSVNDFRSNIDLTPKKYYIDFGLRILWGEIFYEYK